MVSLVKAVSTDATYDKKPLSYNDLQLANARRFCTLDFRMRFENPKLTSEDICKQIGISPRTMAKYKHMIGAPTRHSSKTPEQRQLAYTKGFVTKIRHVERKKFLAELAKKGLSADETQKWIEAWDREHAGIGSTPVSGTASGALGTARERRKVRGGKPQEPAEQQQQATDASVVVRGGTIGGAPESSEEIFNAYCNNKR